MTRSDLATVEMRFPVGAAPTRPSRAEYTGRLAEYWRVNYASALSLALATRRKATRKAAVVFVTCAAPESVFVGSFVRRGAARPEETGAAISRYEDVLRCPEAMIQNVFCPALGTKRKAAVDLAPAPAKTVDWFRSKHRGFKDAKARYLDQTEIVRGFSEAARSRVLRDIGADLLDVFNYSVADAAPRAPARPAR